LPAAGERGTSDPEYRKEVEHLRKQITGNLTTVDLVDGSRLEDVMLVPIPEYRLAAAAPDSAAWHSIEGEATGTTWPGIASLTYVSHGRGAADGLGIGFVIGALFGLAVGAASGAQDQSDSLIEFSPAEGAAIGAAGFGVAGGLIGLVIGAIKGHRITYASQEWVVGGARIDPDDGSSPSQRDR